MKPCLDVVPCMEVGIVRASATFQDPDVRLRFPDSESPCVRLDEGGVTLVIEFPDLDSLTRFVQRLARIPVPGGRRR